MLLTDVVMPQMPGKQLADKVRAGWPGIQVLFISGYTQGLLSAPGVLERDVHLIEKPSDQATLLTKLNEVLHDTAFDKHTYKHTTMGFLKDIQDMPNQYDYSLKFFDRYYRPEYTTIIVVGDVKAKAVRAMVDKYWGEWKHGSYKPEIPVEPPQNGARKAHVDWPSPCCVSSWTIW